MTSNPTDEKHTPVAADGQAVTTPPVDGGNAAPPASARPAPPPDDEEGDASRKEVILYAAGNIENAIANQFFGVINLLMVVAMGISPLLIGLVMGIKTVWDGVTDPVMAYITDNTRSRWGRRRPYILVGGVGRIMFLLLVVAFFPQSERMKTNADLEAEKKAADASRSAAIVKGAGATNALAAFHPAPTGMTELAAAAGTGLVAAAESVAASTAAPAARPKPRGNPFSTMVEGVKAFSDPAYADQRSFIIYVLVIALIFTTLTTMMSVPYYALGIELCPSYNGRTRVVTYRAVVDKVAGLVAPWVAPFCFLLWFKTALDGLLWVAVFAVLIGVPSTVLMVMYTHERTHITVQKSGKMQLGFWKSMWYTLKNPHFLKIFALYEFIGFSNGLFTQIGTFLNIYWVMGSALKGTSLGAAVGMVAWALGFASLPLLNWACRRLQKHNTLRIAVIWMSIGCALKWWCMTPEHPEYQFILPFFFSIGIGSVSAVLSTMMADVTDVDELYTGTRREGMFGATMAFLMKTIGSLTPVLAGAILVLSGFDPELQVQTPKTILNMRLLYSFVPGGMLLFSLFLLWRYPLTKERMAEIKAELKRRHEAAAGAATA